MATLQQAPNGGSQRSIGPNARFGLGTPLVPFEPGCPGFVLALK